MSEALGIGLQFSLDLIYSYDIYMVWIIGIIINYVILPYGQVQTKELSCILGVYGIRVDHIVSITFWGSMVG